MKANDLHNFQFTKVSSGCYLVTYTTEKGDYYRNEINDMPLIDNTLHAEWAKLKDIEHLRDCVKRGSHYNSAGQRLDTL